MKIRQAAVAGAFYPGDAEELEQLLDEFLETGAESNPRPKAIISPHAGYIYSGPIAGSVFSLFKNASEIKRVIVLGPSHRVPFRGIAASTANFYQTPLGNVEIDLEALKQLEGLDFVGFLDQAHQHEHSLEVQIPFIQKLFPQAKILPLVVGDAEPQQVGEVIEKLWGGEETLIVISSDLSHYHPYDEARQIDAKTTKAIENCAIEDFDHQQACGATPVKGLLYVAKKKDLPVRTLDLRNSGDTAGNKDQVVGYGAYAVG
jgi:AmmeMemoRadiSam system protein B